MKSVRIRTSIALIALAGCNEFDPRLYEQVELAATASASSDTCVEATVPLIASSPDARQIDLAPMDDSWQVANCAEGRAAGNDGFFAVDMEQGQKFHFHVTALDLIDPVLYVVDTCDERVCQPLNSASSCANDKEHLSFLAPRAGRYFVGVDSAEPGGGRVELLAISPVCGDGEKQHSEACDDGNVVGGDGCDARCRLELSGTQALAQEPNDDVPGANVFAVAAVPAALGVRGVLESPCDPEVFTFTVPSAAQVTVRMLNAAGNTCTALHPEQRVELHLLQGLTSVAQGQPMAGNACPSLGPHPLQATSEEAQPAWLSTTYHVRLATHGPADAPPLEYVLAIDIDP
jgi:cysteine-rich repeat protein